MTEDNKRLKAEYQKLFEQLTEILFRHDPFGMNLEDTTSEYEPEARTILPRLRMSNNSDEVATAAYEEFQKWFGPDVAGGKERYHSLGEEIWHWWNQRDTIRNHISSRP